MRTFPHYHPRKGEPTYFVEKIWESIGLPDKEFSFNLPDQYVNYIRRYDGSFPKHHTIRAGNRFKPGDFVRPCVWRLPGGRFAKGNKLIQFAPDTEVVKTWNVLIGQEDREKEKADVWIKRTMMKYERTPIDSKIFLNDGLNKSDSYYWFKPMFPFEGQIICWNYEVEY